MRSQTTRFLKKQFTNDLRRSVSKLTRETSALQGMFQRKYNISSIFMHMNLEEQAESLASDQGVKLIEMAQLHLQSKDDHQLQQTTNNEMVQSLKQISDGYVQQKMPYIEQIRLLSLLPQSWKYESIIATFGRSLHAVAAAH